MSDHLVESLRVVATDAARIRHEQADPHHRDNTAIKDAKARALAAGAQALAGAGDTLPRLASILNPVLRRVRLVQCDGDDFPRRRQALLDFIGELLDQAPPPAAPKPRRKRRQREARKLTGRQTEAVQAFGQCKGNYSATARRMGLAVSSARDLVKAAYTKLGQRVPTKRDVEKAEAALSSDRRGNVNVASGPMPDARGDGKSRRGYDRRLD